MDRRHFTSGSVSLFALFSANVVYSLTRSDLSNVDAIKGLKSALEKGALLAIGILGAQDGFLGNDSVRIVLQGARVDERVTTMNRGAEAAMPMAKDLLVNAVQSMSVTDAKGSQYNEVAGRAAELGLLKKDDANIQQYVTSKALDGLFFMISEEENKIRKKSGRLRQCDSDQGGWCHPVNGRRVQRWAAVWVAVAAVACSPVLDWREVRLEGLQASEVQSHPIKLGKPFAGQAFPTGAPTASGGSAFDLLSAQGMQPDGKSVQARLAWISAGDHLYHVAVYGPRLDHERLETLFTDLRLQ